MGTFANALLAKSLNGRKGMELDLPEEIFKEDLIEN